MGPLTLYMYLKYLKYFCAVLLFCTELYIMFILLADTTGFRYGKSVEPEHPQMSGSALVRLQLILTIRRDSAQVAAQRRGIRW